MNTKSDPHGGQNRRPSVSIVICCYNSAKRLPDTLSYLSKQRDMNNHLWEVIVIDNASTDSTGQVALETWSRLGCTAPIHVIAEPRNGLQYARLRGIEAARHEIVSFIDDDNWVCDDWISRVSCLMGRHHDAGACGGTGIPVFEGREPAWFSEVSRAFAVGAPHAAPGFLTQSQWTLWGAGLSVRRAVLLDFMKAGWSPQLSCRRGNALASGGDTEICMLIRLAGWKLMYEPSLVFQHFIAKEKCHWDYVIRLFREFGISSVVTYQYAHLAFLTPRDGALSRLRMRLVRIWSFELIRSIVAVTYANTRYFLYPRARNVFERNRALQKGRLAALISARREYGSSMRKLREVLSKARTYQSLAPGISVPKDLTESSV